MVSWSNLEKLCSCSRTWMMSALACGNKWIQGGTYRSAPVCGYMGTQRETSGSAVDMHNNRKIALTANQSCQSRERYAIYRDFLLNWGNFLGFLQRFQPIIFGNPPLCPLPSNVRLSAYSPSALCLARAHLLNHKRVVDCRDKFVIAS